MNKWNNKSRYQVASCWLFILSCRQTWNTHFMSNNFFPPENWVVYKTMWKNFVERGRPQMTIWRMRIACWIPNGYKCTYRLCNTHCSSTATVVERTRLNITLRTLPVFLLCCCHFTSYMANTVVQKLEVTEVLKNFPSLCSNLGSFPLSKPEICATAL